jgi:hypothetical protein
MALEKIVFETNKPQEIALTFDVGKQVTGNYGEQFYYSTTDGKCFYLPLPVGEIIHKQLAEQHLKAKERFDLVRAETREKGTTRIRWVVKRIDPLGPQANGTFAVPTIPAPQAPAPTELEQKLRESIQRATARVHPPENKNGAGVVETPAPGQAAHEQPNASSLNQQANGTTSRVIPINGNGAKTKLEDALCTVAAALLAAERYAKAIGYEAWPKQFTGDEVVRLANTMLINGARENGNGHNGGAR